MRAYQQPSGLAAPPFPMKLVLSIYQLQWRTYHATRSPHRVTTTWLAGPSKLKK